MRKTLIVLAAVSAIAIFAAPSMAARNKGGGTTGSGTSSIELASVTNSDARLLNATQPSLGSKVTFKTTIEPLAGWEYPMVAVWCYQDLNGDGIHYFPNDNGDLVYMQLDDPSAAFQLGGGSSDWLSNGGPADCVSMLYAYGNKGKTETIRELASTKFGAAA